MKRLVYHISLFTLLLSACTGREDNKKNASSLPPLVKPATIILQPFDDCPQVLIDSLHLRLEKVNPDILVRKPIPLPKLSYYPPRNRYRADSLINYLWRRSTTQSVVLGLTTKDISTRKGKVEDWGIMGLAYCPGYSCVVSTYRLPRNDINNSLYKVSIHELGHTQGLQHCEASKSCIMRDYQGKNILNELSGFCHTCKHRLDKKGWNVEEMTPILAE